jgi:hypothetical protein
MPPARPTTDSYQSFFCFFASVSQFFNHLGDFPEKPGNTIRQNRTCIEMNDLHTVNADGVILPKKSIPKQRSLDFAKACSRLFFLHQMAEENIINI